MDLIDHIRASQGEQVVIALELLDVILELVIMPLVIAVEGGRAAEILLLDGAQDANKSQDTSIPH